MDADGPTVVGGSGRRTSPPPRPERPPVPNYTALPPLDALPAAVTKVAQELGELRVRKADLSREEGELTRTDGRADAPMKQAQKADAELLAVAARDGKDLAKVGTPNADKLEAAIQANTTAQIAVKTALEQVGQELHETLIEHIGEAEAETNRRLSEAGADYLAAIDTLAQARRQFLNVRAIERFLAKAQSERHRGQINYHPADEELTINRREVSADSVLGALRNEAQGAPARPRHYTQAPGFDDV